MKSKNNPSEPSPIFQRGYSAVKEKVDKNPRYYMSCFTCDFYYQAVGDTCEVCQNSSVLEYDMVFDPDNVNSVYCLRWVRFKGHDSVSEVVSEPVLKVRGFFKPKKGVK